MRAAAGTGSTGAIAAAFFANLGIAVAIHPFGYGRSRYFWAFVVSVVLFSLGGIFSLYEGYHKISEPEEITSPAVAFVIFDGIWSPSLRRPMLLVPTGTCHEFYPRGTVPIVETGPLCARRGCPRPDWRDGLCHACWRLAVLFKKDPGMFAYKPLHDYGDELDAVEFPWEEWEREASFRGLNLPDVIARTRGEEEPPKERRPAEEPWEEPWPPEERWPDEEQWPDT